MTTHSAPPTHPTSLPTGTRIGQITWEWLSGGSLDFDDLMPQDPKLLDATPDDFASPPSNFLDTEGITYCYPRIFYGDEGVDECSMPLLNDFMSYVGSSFTYDYTEPVLIWLVGNTSAGIDSRCDDPQGPGFNVVITETVANPGPRRQVVRLAPPPKQPICLHLGKKQTPGGCKGNCPHECLVFGEREDVQLHLQGNKLNAIPNKTCRGCPGYEPD